MMQVWTDERWPRFLGTLPKRTPRPIERYPVNRPWIVRYRSEARSPAESIAQDSLELAVKELVQGPIGPHDPPQEGIPVLAVDPQRADDLRYVRGFLAADG